MSRLIICIFAILLMAAPVVGETATEKVLVKVNGLVCSFCAVSIEKSFAKTESLENVEVDLDNARVELDFKPGKRLPDEEIKKLITEAGYTPVKILDNVVE